MSFSLTKRQHDRIRPNSWMKQSPDPTEPNMLRWSRVSSMNLYMHPVYGMLLGWSLLPHFKRYEMQHESGTKRSAFGRIKLLSLVALNQTLSRQSSKRMAPQHLYCKNDIENRSSYVILGEEKNSMYSHFVASSQWLWSVMDVFHNCQWMFC